MIHRKAKGQGLVEFALILPILLMLLLGIVEGARIIWAYVTVQNAAREAARYAVTGRPFACGTDPMGSPDWTVYCDDPTRGDPWSAQVISTTRVAAIKAVARRVAQNLNVSVWADADINTFNANLNTPGAFGIAVIGQSAVYTQGLGNYAGEPGWNVRIETYYNVEMIDPIFDVIMGGQTIHLVGEVELQNEGIDATVKQYIGGITYQTDSCAPNCGGGSVPFISVQDEFNDFIEPAGGTFTVSVNDHLPNTAYRLYFTNGTFTQYMSFTTDNLGGKLLNFVISVAAPVTNPLPPTGSPNYKIYTTLESDPSTPVATCLGDQANTPCFGVSGAAATITARNVDGTVSYGGTDYVQKQQPVDPARWPISSSIPIYLFGHDVNTSYTILFNGVNATAAPGKLLFQGSSTTQIPTDSQFGTNLNNEPAYYIAENHSPGSLTITSQDMSGTNIATTTVDLIQASLDIQGETPTSKHPEDDILTIILRNHAPQQEYRVYFDDGVSAPFIGRADDNGELVVGYVVPHGVHTPGTPAVPVDIYTLDYGRGPNTNRIAQRTIMVETPINPYINVPGGARWPAGSPIVIQLRRHQYTPPTGTEYAVYIQQGPASSPTFSQLVNNTTYWTSQNPNTGLGEVDINYTIPFSYSGFYTIRSFLPNDLNNPVAEFDIEVTSQPHIEVQGGKRWPPGSKVTVQLSGHASNTPYDVWLDRGGPQETFLGTVIVDGSGFGTIDYTIPLTMPSKINPGYSIRSYLGSTLTADDGELEVYPAELVVSNIDLPNVIFDVEIPITLTVANNSPVAVTNTYFDTDMYIDPVSAPDPLNSGLPPGDYKTWLNNVPASGTVQITDTIVLYGPQSHNIYARVDTSRNVAESIEDNNVTLKTVSASCQVEIADEFDNGVVESWWTQTSFGDAGPACPTLADLPPPTGGSGGVIDEFYWPNSGDPNSGHPGGTVTRVDNFLGGDAAPGSAGFSSSSYYGNPFSSLYVGPRGSTNRVTSTGAQIQFTNTQPNVTIDFDYETYFRNLDTNDWAEYYFLLDGTPYTPTGSGTYLTRLVPSGNNQNKSPASSGWPHFSRTFTLTPGTHTLIFGARASRMNRSNERVYMYVDNLVIREQGPPQPPPTVPNTISEFHYDSDAQGFTFAPDVYYNLTSQGRTPTGSYQSSNGGWANGSLRVELGRTSTGRDMTGAWSQTFYVSNPGGTCITIQGYYRMEFGYYDTFQGEYAEALIAVDDPSAPVVINTLTGGDNNTIQDTGWQTFNVSFSLPQGTHTVYLGGFNNSSSENREFTNIWFDDVYIVDAGSGTSTSAQSESGGVLTLLNRGSDALSSNDNTSSAGYHLMHRAVGQGPFEVYVRLDRPATVNSNSRAGLEVRADTTGNADKLMFVYRNNGRLQVLTRQNNGSVVSARTVNVGNITPVWLRISRNGDTFTFDYVSSSSDTPPAAGSWNSFYTLNNFVLPDTVEVGMINAPQASGNPTGNSSYEARFKHFHVCATSAPGGGTGSNVSYLGSRCGQVEENGNGLVVLDAINTIINQSGSGHTWQNITMNNVLGEPTMEGIEVSPDGGADMAAGVGPHATYQVNFQSSGTYYVWIAGWGPDTNGDDVHFGLNGVAQGVVSGFPTGSSSPGWVKMSGSVNISAGINTIDLWGKEDGARVFKILLTQNPNFTPPAVSLSQSACTIISEQPVPPLLQVCTDPIRRGDFEGAIFEVTPEWKTENLATAYSTVAYQSNHGAGFPNYGGRMPRMSQAFDLPGWILSNTTAILSLKRGVDLNFSGVSTATDQLYFTLRWESEPAPPNPGFDLITPTMILDGVDRTPAIPDMNSLNPQPSDWTDFNQDIFAGINPLSVLQPGLRVRAYFYTTNPGAGTAFFLDNISLNICTTQPEPQQVSGGKLSGFTQRNGQPLVGATVWAYAYSEDGSTPGPVFKTYSIQDGSFRFYNLPPGQYLIYAEITDASGSFFATYRVTVSDGSDIKNVILNLVTG